MPINLLKISETPSLETLQGEEYFLLSGKLENEDGTFSETLLRIPVSYAVKSERALIDSSSIRLYGVKNNQDVFEAPRSNTSLSEADENAGINNTTYDRFLEKDVYIYQSTIMRRDGSGRCSILAPVYPKHITNKEYVDNTVQQAIQQAVLDSWEVGV